MGRRWQSSGLTVHEEIYESAEKIVTTIVQNMWRNILSMQSLSFLQNKQDCTYTVFHTITPTLGASMDADH